MTDERREEAGDDKLAWVGEELRAAWAQFEIDGRLSAWEEIRSGVLRELERRREHYEELVALSEAAAIAHEGRHPSESTWPEAIGRWAYGEIFLRIQLYRADLAIRQLRSGSKLDPQSHGRMAKTVFAVMEDARDSVLERIERGGAEDTIQGRIDPAPQAGDELADGGNPRIVGGEEIDLDEKEG
jgi:hypothetical protein